MSVSCMIEGHQLQYPAMCLSGSGLEVLKLCCIGVVTICVYFCHFLCYPFHIQPETSSGNWCDDCEWPKELNILGKNQGKHPMWKSMKSWFSPCEAAQMVRTSAVISAKKQVDEYMCGTLWTYNSQYANTRIFRSFTRCSFLQFKDLKL